MPSGLATACEVFASLNKLILFLCQFKVFVLSVWARGHDIFSPYWLVLGYTLIFPSLKFTSLSTCFLRLFWNTTDMSVSLPSVIFGKAIFVPVDMHNFAECITSFTVNCLMFIILLTHLSCSYHLFQSLSTSEIISVATESSSLTISSS